MSFPEITPLPGRNIKEKKNLDIKLYLGVKKNVFSIKKRHKRQRWIEVRKLFWLFLAEQTKI